MRKETVIFGLVAIGVIAFLLGRLTAPEPTEVPARPDPAAVRPPTTAVAAVPAGSAAAAPGGVPGPGTAAVQGTARRPLVDPALLPPGARGTGGGAPTLGPPDAKVTLVVISDFQCPFCKKVEPTVQRLRREYPDDVQVVWKNNPLPMHPRALPAAIAALAAHRQGKFWEYHDRIFQKNDQLSDEDLVRHAADLGLDVGRFRQDLADPALREQVQREQAAAQAVGARGTPAFFVNGKPLVGARPYAEFKAFVEEARVAADRALAEGVPAAALHETLAERNHPEGRKFVSLVLRGEQPRAQAPAQAEAAPTAEARPKPAPQPRRPGQPVPQTVWKVTVGPDDPVKGPADALVTIVEFSDFECPFCSKINPTMAQLMEAFPGQVRIVWKNNPLPFHKNAGLAAQAALAANAQGKFWEYHDLLFQNQRALTRADLERYAAQLELDLTAFRQALDQGTYAAKIAADQALASQVNANGTPNLFVNGRQIVGARPYEDFEPVVREELEKAKQIVARGVSPQGVYGQIIARGKVFKPLADEVKDFAIDDAPSKGATNAPIVITEFSDFQCPYCARVGGPLLEVQQRHPDRVRVVFKHFPLTSIHADAQLAAEASLAANAQGKFWEFAEILFKNQRALKRADLERYAAEVGLDVATFRQALDQGTYREHVQRDVRDGTQAEVRGTPTVFINGRHFQPAGGMSVEALEKALGELTTQK